MMPADLIDALKFVPYNDKIADINESDTAAHYLDLSTLCDNVKAIILNTLRQSGSGALQVYPDEGTQYFGLEATPRSSFVVGVINGRLMYKQSVANDDFDLYCFGYWYAGE